MGGEDPAAGLEIEEEQSVVDDQKIGLARPDQVSAVQAVLPERPPRAQADVAVATHAGPERLRDDERDLRPQTGDRGPGVSRQRLRDLPGARLRQVS